MTIDPGQSTGVIGGAAALEALAAALERLAAGGAVDDALEAIAEATVAVVDAEVVVVRVLDEGEGWLEARAVSASASVSRKVTPHWARSASKDDPTMRR